MLAARTARLIIATLGAMTNVHAYGMVICQK
jgi:hypothetical protein